MQPDLPTNTPTLGCWIGKSQAFGLIAAKCRSATRPLAGPLFGETKPIRPFRTPTRFTKRTQFRRRRQLLVSLKSATSSQSPALGQLRRTNPIPPIPHSPPAAPRLTERSQFQAPPGPRSCCGCVLPNEPNPISGHSDAASPAPAEALPGSLTMSRGPISSASSALSGFDLPVCLCVSSPSPRRVELAFRNGIPSYQNPHGFPINRTLA